MTITTLYLATNSFACDCEMKPVETYINSVDIIITGKVIELLDKIDTADYINSQFDKEFYKNKAHLVKVLILKKLKTGNIKSDTLEFTSDFSNCDPIYKLGESYLFFANKTRDEKYKMAQCTWWGTVKESKRNINKICKALKTNYNN